MSQLGVLALQGDFLEHQQLLQGLSCDAVLVRQPEQLLALDGLIIPGGESSSLLHLMKPFGFLAAIQLFYQSGGAVFGTCAGLILMAKEVLPSQNSLQLLDVVVARNAYGRQLQSFVGSGDWASEMGAPPASPMVFIRAPKITSVDESVQVLAHCEGVPVLVRQGRLLAASFHPEMTEQDFVHRYFIEHCLRCEDES